MEDAPLRLPWSTGAVLYHGGDREAGRCLVEETLARAREVGDRWVEAAALMERAGHRLDDGDVSAARADARHSADTFLRLTDRWGVLRANAVPARASKIDLDHLGVIDLLEEDLLVAEELGLLTDVIETLFRLGRLAAARGERSRARHFHERARRVAAERSYTSGVVEADAWLVRA